MTNNMLEVKIRYKVLKYKWRKNQFHTYKISKLHLGEAAVQNTVWIDKDGEKFKGTPERWKNVERDLKYT